MSLAWSSSQVALYLSLQFRSVTYWLSSVVLLLFFSSSHSRCWMRSLCCLSSGYSRTSFERCSLEIHVLVCLGESRFSNSVFDWLVSPGCPLAH